tara:strand:+ start:9491 stop:10018 length:528 start_codon:yes stop_codon:yes gene_type:complete
MAPDSLANLRDIHLPSDVSAVPAFGWWLLAALMLVVIIGAARIFWKRHQARRYRRQAQQILKQIEAAEKTPREQLQQLTELLKRIALHAYPLLSIASLNGREWTDFLHQSAPNIRSLETVRSLLEQGIYDAREISPADIDQLMSFAAQWIQEHGALSSAPESQPDEQDEVADAHV